MISKSRYSTANLIFWLAAGLILAGAGLFYTRYLLWGDWTYDQGFYFLVAQLMERGYRPFAQIHMSEQPLMAWSAYLPWRVFGSIWGMQLLMVGYALLGLAALIGVGRTLNGRLTGLLAGLLLALHFEFFAAARLVNPETTSLSMALVALAAVLHYRTSNRTVWLVVSAVAMAASFLLKLFLVTVAPLIILILIFYPAGGRTPRRVGHDVLIWLGLLGLILGAVWLSIGVQTWLEQSVYFYINRNAAELRDPALNWSKIWGMLAGWPLLSLLATWGAARCGVKFRQFGWIPLAWLLLTLAFLMAFNPLRSKHLIVLPPVLALLAAVGLSHLLRAWAAHRRGSRVVAWGSGLLLAALVVALAAEIVSPFGALKKPAKPLISQSHQQIVDMLTKFTAPTDCLITDDPYIAIESGRLPPPWLSNMSYARFRSGSLTKDDLIEITTANQCAALVPTFARLKNSEREFYDLAKSHYLRTWVADGAEIMLGYPLTHAEPGIPLGVDFNGQVTLLGADWQAAGDGSRDHYLSLYWKMGGAPFAQNYKIFVQLRNAAGQTVVSADHEMFDGLLPTPAWRPGVILKDTTRVAIPTELAPGAATLYVGLYNPASLERLPVAADSSGENAAVIPVELSE